MPMTALVAAISSAPKGLPWAWGLSVYFGDG